MSKNSKILEKNKSFPQKLLKTATKNVISDNLKVFLLILKYKNNIEKIKYKYIFFIKITEINEIPTEKSNKY